MALPVRLDMRTTSPSRSSFTSCISTMSSLSPSRPMASRGPLEAGHVAVVVGAPDVDDPVEAPDGELVPVVGDVGREVGVEAVGPTEHIVLQVQLLDVRLFFAGPPVVVPEDVGGPEPQSPVLLIGPAPRRQQLHRLGHIAALVEGGLIEPVVVADLVPLQVALHLGQVDGQAELGQLLQPLFLGGGEQRVPVLLVIGLRQVPDVLALVAVLRERHRVPPPWISWRYRASMEWANLSIWWPASFT